MRLLALLLIFLLALPVKAQFDATESLSLTEDRALSISDTIAFSSVETSAVSIDLNAGSNSDTFSNPYKFRATDLIAPAAMIGLGIAGLEWKGLEKVNEKVTDGLWGDGHGKIKIDNYTQYLPALATYGLNLCGVKGLHSYADLTIIMGTAYLMMAAIVYPTKDFVNSPRPSPDPRINSFPSGHAAWAFTGAEIMRREFWHVSPWIGVSGYLVATGTAFLRLYNGAHWLTDVLAGAGIGILCAEAAYWLYPTITKHLFPKQYKSNIFISPSASPTSVGVAAALTF